MSRASIPNALKSITPYVLRSMDLATRNAVVSFYCLQYAVHVGVDMLQGMTEPDKTESTKFLMAQMDRLEKEKGGLGVSDEEARAMVELYSLKMFKRADDADRSGRQDSNVAKMFYTSSLLMEITKQFGDLTEDILEKQRYARWKTVEINRAVKMGLAPTRAAPSMQDDSDDEQHNLSEKQQQQLQPSPPSGSNSFASQQYQQQQQQQQRQQPQRPTEKSVAQPRLAASKPIPSTPSSDTNHTSSNGKSGGKEVSLDDIMLAQKYSKFAVSSLQFNDVAAARKYLQDALNLLNK